jgi:hypothetical protein
MCKALVWSLALQRKEDDELSKDSEREHSEMWEKNRDIPLSQKPFEFNSTKKSKSKILLDYVKVRRDCTPSLKFVF